MEMAFNPHALNTSSPNAINRDPDSKAVDSFAECHMPLQRFSRQFRRFLPVRDKPFKQIT
jgi:hypothetical protein